MREVWFWGGGAMKGKFGGEIRGWVVGGREAEWRSELREVLDY